MNVMAQESDCRIALVKGFRVLRSNFLSTQMAVAYIVNVWT